jgi:hypothetical protein
MSVTLLIIVSSVVILVTALVLLTIFGTGVTPIASLSEQKSMCLSQAAMACRSFEKLPFDWSIANKYERSCREITGCSDCDCVIKGDGGVLRVGGTRVTETLIEVWA